MLEESPILKLAGKVITLTSCHQAKTRYRQDDQSCSVSLDNAGGISVRFDSPQRAPMPGQSLALYQNDRVLGGGVISSTHPSIST